MTADIMGVFLLEDGNEWVWRERGPEGLGWPRAADFGRPRAPHSTMPQTCRNLTRSRRNGRGFRQVSRRSLKTYSKLRRPGRFFDTLPGSNEDSLDLSTPLTGHSGPYNSGEDTDNRPPYRVVAFIERWK